MSIRAEEKKTIVDDLMTNDRHLATALKVLAARDAIVNAVVERFVAALTKRLVATAVSLGPDWELQACDAEGDYLQKEWSIGLKKSSWNDQYYVLIQNARVGPRDFIFGVNNDDELPEGADSGLIQQCLGAKIAVGKRTGWWAWYAPCESKLRHWDDEETLARLCGDELNESVEHIAETLHEVASVAESAIDEEVKRRRT